MNITVKGIPIEPIMDWRFDLSEGVIDKIFEIRSRNNKNWMDLLRLAFKYAPDEASAIMKNITEADSEINKLSKELSK